MCHSWQTVAAQTRALYTKNKGWEQKTRKWDCYLQLKRVKEAQTVLVKATLEQRLSPYWVALEARLDLMLQAADSPEIVA